MTARRRECDPGVKGVRLLIVDGYNVIHAHPDLALLADDAMELARARLVEGLGELARVAEMHVTVVFDAARGHNAEAVRDRVLGVEVVFTGRGVSADAYIEAMALAASRPEDVTVATSDRATQEAVFSRGVLRMSSRELVERMAGAAEEAEPVPARRPATVADMLDEEVVARLKRLGY